MKRVNDDPPGRHQFFNWMAIDQVTGHLYFIFYDQRNTNVIAANVYAVRSTDGGESFQNVRINSATVSLYYSVFDYIGISAYNSKVRPVWMGNNFNIVTAIIDSFYNIGINKISSEVPSAYSLNQNYPNPFNPSTTIRFSIPAVSLNNGLQPPVQLTIFDNIGREIEILVNQNLLPGIYQVTWDGTNFPSGVYYYRLSSKRFIKTGKMILLK